MPITYKDAIDTISRMNVKQRLYILARYKKGTQEWIPVDKVEYLRELMMISHPYTSDFPCELDNTTDKEGHIYIDPCIENL